MVTTYISDMTLTGLCQLELTKNLGPLCIAIGMLIIICSLGQAQNRSLLSLDDDSLGAAGIFVVFWCHLQTRRNCTSL